MKTEKFAKEEIYNLNSVLNIRLIGRFNQAGI